MFKIPAAPQVEISDEDKEILKEQTKKVVKKLAITAAITIGAAVAFRMIGNRLAQDETEETAAIED